MDIVHMQCLNHLKPQCCSYQLTRTVAPQRHHMEHRQRSMAQQGAATPCGTSTGFCLLTPIYYEIHRKLMVFASPYVDHLGFSRMTLLSKSRKVGTSASPSPRENHNGFWL